MIMNKTAQDLAWNCLLLEVKKEVKRQYQIATNAKEYYTECTLEYLFGRHNLTSDAEGEELLTVPRSKVTELYRKFKKDGSNACLYAAATLDALFGSKCLPDEGTDCTRVEADVPSYIPSIKPDVPSSEPKPSIPKFKHKLGDKVRIVNDWSRGYKHNGEVTEIVAIDESDPEVPYKVDIYDEEEGGGLWYSQSDLEPYTEPTANYLRSEGALNTAVLAGNYSSASTCDKQFDNIIKDGFKNHNRLHIAAILAAGMLASEVRCYPVDRALELADKLIAECKKGGGNA